MTGTTGIQISAKRSGRHGSRPRSAGPLRGRAARRGGRAAGCLAVVVVLAWCNVCAAAVQNPSFETYFMGLPWPRPLPSGWGRADHPSFNSYCTNLWTTDGSLSAGLFSRLTNGATRYSFLPGNYQGFHQFVDLTGIRSVKFDVRLAAYPAGTFEHFEASFLVDAVPLWRNSTGGEHRDQEVDVSHLAGWHRIEMRITARDSGTFPVAYWTQWDNVRLIEGPATIPATIDLNPNTLSLDSNGAGGTDSAQHTLGLNLGSNGRWITCYIELGEGYDVNSIDLASVTLNEVPAHMGKEGWATPEANDENIMDHDGDGVLERMVKFDRAAVQDIVQPPQATVTVKGKLAGGTPFEGAADIRVVEKGPKQK